jgi:hypothetical protein
LYDGKQGHFPLYEMRESGKRCSFFGNTRKKVLPQRPLWFTKENALLSNRSGFRGQCPLEIALFVRTRDHWACLQELLHQIFMATRRALFRDRLMGGGELARGIISTAVESISFPGPFLDQVALMAERTLYSDEVLLYVLTFRISAAGSELAVAAVANHHVPSTFGADFVQRDIRNLLALI